MRACCYKINRLHTLNWRYEVHACPCHLISVFPEFDANWSSTPSPNTDVYF